MAAELDSGEERRRNRTKFTTGKHKTAEKESHQNLRSSRSRHGIRNQDEKRKGRDGDVQDVRVPIEKSSITDANEVERRVSRSHGLGSVGMRSVRDVSKEGVEDRVLRRSYGRENEMQVKRFGNDKGRNESGSKRSVTADGRTMRGRRGDRADARGILNKTGYDSEYTSDESTEEEGEGSNNGQILAINPSPAILSFVENNLLGYRCPDELKKAGYNLDLPVPLDNIPFSTNNQREPIEESVFRNRLEFFASAKVSRSFPPAILPEIAFAGRFNVKKSSLLKALTRQWGVQRTFDKSDLTHAIKFFRIASQLCLVDLPGYGFPHAKEEVDDDWMELVKEYVSSREGLERVCLLIDSKWGMKPRDRDLVDLMERSKTPYQIVLTKTDLVFPMNVARRAMQIQEDLKARECIVKPVMMVSSKSGAGIRSLRSVLAKLARFARP